MKFTREILSAIDSELEGLSYSVNNRNNLSAALFDIAIDHAKSIVILIENNIHSSAYALVRPMFESFVRAAWILHCATDIQIRNVIKNDKFPFNFGEMLGFVEKNNNWALTLTEIKRTAIRNMHSYTHGGMQMIARRFTESELVHVPNQKEIHDILRFIALIGFLSFTGIVFVSNSTVKDDFIKELYAKIVDTYFS